MATTYQISDDTLTDFANEARRMSGTSDPLTTEEMLNIYRSSGGGGLGVQADYGQNDPTKADHIKNRPFHIEYGDTIFDEDVTIVPDTTTIGLATVPGTIFNEAADGDCYEVTFNNASYICQLYKENEGFLFGNISIYGCLLAEAFRMTIEEFITLNPDFARFVNDTGEPFFIILDAEAEAMIMSTVDEGTYHLTITKVSIKNDSRFNYLLQPDHNQNDANATNYVKNRTHFKYHGVIMYETDIITVFKDEYTPPLYEYDDADLIAGDEGDLYVVTWDGGKYDCPLTINTNMEMTYIGNGIIYLDFIVNFYSSLTGTPLNRDEVLAELPELDAFNNDTGEPFLIFIQDGIYGFITSEAGTHTCRIEGPCYRKLDKRFVPTTDALPSVSESDNGKTMVVEGGKWVASTAPTGLPEVTTDDDDKVLIVVDGVWVAGSIADGDGVAY